MINRILNEMKDKLKSSDLKALEKVLKKYLSNEKKDENRQENNAKLVQEFIANKKFEGCSNKTIEQYEYNVGKFLSDIGKAAVDVNKNDIKGYLAKYQSTHDVSNVTINNMLRYITSFFNYLENEEIILLNPARKIKSIKTEKVIKKPLSDVEVEELRQSTTNLRDMAIIEVLYATGIRVSELCQLNRTDIKNDMAVVKGKGSKERKIYFSQKSMYYLNQYLQSRKDTNEALFVGLKKPYTRISVECVETICRTLGKVAEVEKVHPHRFRRTMATRALNKGMPIQEVQMLLGHSKIDTTMIYCSVDEDNIKLSHKKYVA